MDMVIILRTRSLQEELLYAKKKKKKKKKNRFASVKELRLLKIGDHNIPVINSQLLETKA